MELVPEEELEAVAQAKPTAFADQRARKVAFIQTFWLLSFLILLLALISLCKFMWRTT